jgi:RNA polymerase-binding transcription factor DksA
MSSRVEVHRVSRPRRRSIPQAPRARWREELLRHLLAETDLAVRRRLHDVRERHPLEAAEATEAEERIQVDSSREIEASLLEHEAESRRLIEDALRQAVRRGDLCSRCGEPIGEARLRAVPFTDLCRACKDREEAASAPPARYTPLINS